MRWSGQGTFENEFMGLKPTHEEGDPVRGITIDRYEGGKIAESWTHWDTLTLMRNVGAIPERSRSFGRQLEAEPKPTPTRPRPPGRRERLAARRTPAAAIDFVARMGVVRTVLAAFAVVAAALALAAPASAATQLKVGVGRADITPPTGYYMMGWVRSDAVSAGQHTRLWARVIVLERGGQKMALVAEDLGGIPGGMVAEAAERASDLGFSAAKRPRLRLPHPLRADRLLQLLHLQHRLHDHRTRRRTSSSPAASTRSSTPSWSAAWQLAIRRADANLGPGKLGWGKTQITDLTDNRSVEAHLRNHGIREEFGEGSADQDPQGRLHTLDPDVNVLRVDKMIGGRQVPVGMWSTFADHGTVGPLPVHLLQRDHHGAATQLVEDAIRRAGQVPAGQEVVNAYGNTDEGDQTAGLHRAGPAAAD